MVANSISGFRHVNPIQPDAQSTIGYDSDRMEYFVESVHPQMKEVVIKEIFRLKAFSIADYQYLSL